MGVTAGLDRFQRRHTWLGFPVAVVYKFVDDQGGFLAALITYYGFLSLFPGLLLLVTALGYFLSGNPSAQQKIIDTALAKFPVIGTQLEHNLSSIHGSSTAIIIGVLGLLYGALGIGQATQLAFNRAWAVPRNERPNVLVSRLRSFGFVLLIGVGLVATTILTGISAATGSLNSDLNDLIRLAFIAASILANAAL